MRARHNAWRGFGAATIAAAVFVLTAITGKAETTYPDRPVRIVLPYGPGGVADVSTRLVAAKLSERLGQNFFVDNRPGPGGIVAAKAALNLPADGYALYLSGNGGAISESLFASLPFSIVRDFTSVSFLAQFDMLLATKADAQIDTVQKLVAYAKQNSGKLNFGTIAVGSTQNLSAELFKMVTGANATFVNFRTTPDLMTAIVRGDVDVGFDYYAAFSPMITSKQIKIIATSGNKPSSLLNGVPTVKDAGYPDYVVTSWNAFSARTGTSADIISKLNAEIRAVLEMPEIRTKMAELGMEPVAASPEALRARLVADVEKWRVVIEKSGIPKQ
ncbi:MAG TPA: tripartite tricarboxylate transporter substrate-binding protein [Xanthobacteraceae bacterium]|jgi:tripartite-type tricarboxylate transporter receptor subunit TctC|nr:tripartite tricarboxylate transporter substrate-binding protein [Xanthobacteraceae bacterium]